LVIFCAQINKPLSENNQRLQSVKVKVNNCSYDCCLGSITSSHQMHHASRPLYDIELTEAECQLLIWFSSLPSSH